MAIPAVGSLGALSGLSPVETAKKAAKPAGEGQGDFGNVVVNALESLNALQSKSDNLAVKAATGDLSDVHDYMIASTEASLATEFTVAIRNRAVEAFNEIMRMQI
ncbi:MAG TPA: flagellar hook-basal body complex protein FliE [Acidimicrobiia bacterium]|nr:flagellar hook-basal body complex protein FliE [Acidimicrobiia bacterium]